MGRLLSITFINGRIQENIKPAPIEKDVDLLLQSFQYHTAVENVLSPVHNQTKTSTLVSLSSVNKSHKPLPCKYMTKNNTI